MRSAIGASIVGYRFMSCRLFEQFVEKLFRARGLPPTSTSRRALEDVRAPSMRIAFVINSVGRVCLAELAHAPALWEREQHGMDCVPERLRDSHVTSMPSATRWHLCR